MLVEGAGGAAREFSRQHPQIVFAQIGFLTAKNIKILKFPVFEIGLEPLQAVIRGLCRLSCHISAL